MGHRSGALALEVYSKMMSRGGTRVSGLMRSPEVLNGRAGTNESGMAVALDPVEQERELYPAIEAGLRLRSRSGVLMGAPGIERSCKRAFFAFEDSTEDSTQSHILHPAQRGA
jgi:hypothetical protein